MFSVNCIVNKVIKNKTLKDGGLYSIYSFIGRGTSFVLLILLASYIQPEEYGELSLFNTVVMLLGYFMGLSSFGYFSVSFFKNTVEDFKKDFTIIVSLYLMTTAFFFLVLIAFGNYLSSILHLSVKLLWYAVIISLFNIFFYISQDYARVREKVGTYGVLSCGNALANFVLSIVLVISFQQGWMGRVNAQLLCTLLFGVIALFIFIRHNLFNFQFSRERYKVILLYCLPIIPHLTTNWIRQGCDRYIIDYNFSIYDVGLFSFALNLVGVFNMIGFSFNSTNSVSLYKLLSNEDNLPDISLRIARLTRMMFSIYTIACVALAIVLPSIVYVFLPKYVPSLGYFFVLCLYGYLECLYYIYCNYLFYYEKTRQIMYITFGTSILHLVLSLLLTKYSLYYTAVIYIIVDAVVLFWIRAVAIKLRREHFNLK